MVGQTLQDEYSEFFLEKTVDSELRISRSPIDGQGCFAAVQFHRHQLIAEFVGEKITIAEADRRRCKPGRKSICDVNLKWAIDGSRGGNGTEYINHSCHPSCYLMVEGDRIFLYARRDIASGEEITTDYLYELGLEGRRCKCHSPVCATDKTPLCEAGSP